MHPVAVPKTESKHKEHGNDRQLRTREHDLQFLDTRNIDEVDGGEYRDQATSNPLRSSQTELSKTQRYDDACRVIGRQEWEEMLEVSGDRQGRSRNGRREACKKADPPVDEAPCRSPRLGKVNVLT